MNDVCIWCHQREQAHPEFPEFCSQDCADAAFEFATNAILSMSAKKQKGLFDDMNFTGRAKQLADSIVLDTLSEEGGSAIDPDDLPLFGLETKNDS